MRKDASPHSRTARIDPINLRVPAVRAGAMLVLGVLAAGCKDSMTEPWVPENELVARDRAALEALYNATEGGEWARQDNWLTDTPLGEWHGVVTDSVGQVTWLTLPGNGLKGRLPSEIGDLRELQYLGLADNELKGPVPPLLGDLPQLVGLFLANNRLTGVIPGSFLQLQQLRVFDFGGNPGLCVPGTTEFAEWADGIGQVIGLSCSEADRRVLGELFRQTGGSGWDDSSGWLGDTVLEEWFGVQIDSIGRVFALTLVENELAGALPEVVGELSALRWLDVAGNRLTGELPRSLVDLSLEVFRYADTRLYVPHDAEFQEWLETVAEHDGTATNCTPAAEREALIAFYKATDGPNWVRNDNWMTNAPIGDWHGVTVNRSGEVTRLRLGYNGVRGVIPSALGGLPNLTALDLNGNWGLTGPLPGELFGLSRLQELGLYRIGLAGPLPPGIGRLTELRELMLRRSGLAGPIPEELGRLVNLEYLNMADNDLTGPIPKELGTLSISGTWVYGATN